MPKRKVWTEEEDRILRFLRQERGERKWESIARVMEIQFNIPGRSGKQCRERYHNHLDSSIINSEWRAEQQQILFIMHEQIGNKWSTISQKLPGRSDNCVKNHFYSKLRKSIRKLNKMMDDEVNKEREPTHIKVTTLYKIIQIQETKFKISSKVDQQLADFCKSIKNRLFLMNDDEEIDEKSVQDARRLIVDIEMFETNYKKGYRGIKRGEYEMQSKGYLKPPKSGIRRSNSSVSSDRSEDSSYLSSCVSSYSDLSECDDNKKSKTTRSRRGSSGVNSDIIKEEKMEHELPNYKPEIYFDRVEDLMSISIQQFAQDHEDLIDEQPHDHQIYEQEYFDNMMYEDTPVRARILGPSLLHFDEEDFRIFPSRMDNEDEPIQFRESEHEY